MAREKLLDARQHVGFEGSLQAAVAALFPAVRLVAVRIEEAAQGARARVIGKQTGQHEDRMTVAACGHGEPRPHQPEGAELRQSTAFHQHEGSRGRSKRGGR